MAYQVGIFHNLRAQLPSTFSCLSQKNVLAENLIHSLSGIPEKYQGRREAGTHLRRDRGVLDVPLGDCFSAWVSRHPTQQSLKGLLKMWIWGMRPQTSWIRSLGLRASASEFVPSYPGDSRVCSCYKPWVWEDFRNVWWNHLKSSQINY